jgi:RNA polymerase sigma-70 factor (ECF subfamily)
MDIFITWFITKNLQTTHPGKISSTRYRAMNITLEDIIKDCKGGKRKAQKMLYEKFYRQMLGVCLRYCASKPEAEDVMLIGFMNVFTKIDSFTGSGSFEGWMKKVMINTAIDNFRKQKKHADLYDISLFEEELVQEIYLPESLSINEILVMVQKLPTGYRTVFNLYAIEGFSHQEIAEMLGVTVNTSKTQLFKARKLLQNSILRMNMEIQKRNDSE